MNGGTFTEAGRVRPGVYANVIAQGINKKYDGNKGTVVIPLIGYDYGPKGEFIEINVESPDANIEKLGRSVFDETNEFMLRVSMALLNAEKVLAYSVGTGAAAEVICDNLIVSAKYNGERGNSLMTESIENAEGGFDIKVYLENNLVETYEGLETVQELIDINTEKYVVFKEKTPQATLKAFSKSKLVGGTSTAPTNEEIMTFLDLLEIQSFDWLVMSMTEKEINAAIVEKVRYLNDRIGKLCGVVMVEYPADYENVINLTNSFKYGGIDLPILTAASYVAGAQAKATELESLTYAVVEGATGIVSPKPNEVAEKAIKDGEMFFSMNGENVVIEYDINSLVTFTEEKTEDYHKNKIIRVHKAFIQSLYETFVPGKFRNTEDDWNVMESLGKALLNDFEERGAITNVQDDDFILDRTRSNGDSTYITVGLQAVDATDKYYFNIITR